MYMVEWGDRIGIIDCYQKIEQWKEVLDTLYATEAGTLWEQLNQESKKW